MCAQANLCDGTMNARAAVGIPPADHDRLAGEHTRTRCDTIRMVDQALIKDDE